MRTIILSDLHLGAGAGAATSDALVSFLGWVEERSREDTLPYRVVVLGDFLDLLHAPADARDPLAALDAVAREHRPVLAALGAGAARGLRVDVVPGNHDSELADRDVQERLRMLVADAAGTSTELLRERFRVRPWFLFVPGVLYAEHGSQYHALNAVADPLAPFGRWSDRLPPGAVLDLVRATDRPRVRGLLPASLRGLAGRRRSGAPTVASLRECAAESGLSTGSLESILGLAENSPAALVHSAYTAARGHRGLVEAQQQRAAVAIDRIVAGEGQRVPVYVFGHTHRAAQVALDADGAELLWFNAGAWIDGGHGFVEVSGRPGNVVARLRRWDPVARSAIALDGALSAPGRARQERAPTRRPRRAGSGSAAPVVRP